MSDILSVIIGAVLLILLTTVLVTIPVMLLWNCLMPAIFGLTTITFWQALGLSMLCGCLFKNTSSSSK